MVPPANPFGEGGAVTRFALQMVPDAEFDRGIAELRRYCEREDRGQPVEDPIEVFRLARPRAG
jgi:hypothetical protein